MDMMEIKWKIADFNPGDNIIHSKFGKGTICHKNEGGNLVDIDFNGKVNKMNLEVLVANSLIRKLD